MLVPLLAILPLAYVCCLNSNTFKVKYNAHGITINSINNNIYEIIEPSTWNYIYSTWKHSTYYR